MTCRYFVPDTDLQQKLLGATPLNSRKAIVEYRDLLYMDDAVNGAVAAPLTGQRLREVLNECRTVGSIEPLRQHRRALEKLGEPAKDAQGRSRRMMELLGVKGQTGFSHKWCFCSQGLMSRSSDGLRSLQSAFVMDCQGVFEAKIGMIALYL